MVLEGRHAREIRISECPERCGKELATARGLPCPDLLASTGSGQPGVCKLDVRHQVLPSPITRAAVGMTDVFILPPDSRRPLNVQHLILNHIHHIVDVKWELPMAF